MRRLSLLLACTAIIVAWVLLAHAVERVPTAITARLERFWYHHADGPSRLVTLELVGEKLTEPARAVQHHSFATGGHGKDEYFGKPGMLSDRVDGRTAETCNVYNMLKLTRRLFALRPDAHYADFHERTLFNHILASIDPEDGRTCYMVPVGRGVLHNSTLPCTALSADSVDTYRPS